MMRKLAKAIWRALVILAFVAMMVGLFVRFAEGGLEWIYYASLTVALVLAFEAGFWCADGGLERALERMFGWWYHRKTRRRAAKVNKALKWWEEHLHEFKEPTDGR